VLIYERKKYTLFLSWNIAYSIYEWLHIVDLFHTFCHDISIVITFSVTSTSTHLLQYYGSCLVVYYCMCLKTPDSILTSFTIIRHLWVCIFVTTIHGQWFEPPTDYDTWPMVWASYWLIINTDCTLLPIHVHWNVCNQWYVSNTVATVRQTFSLHPVLYILIQ
jgi:hypothetical protein